MLDHIVVFGEAICAESLRFHGYYNGFRMRISLDKNTPGYRPSGGRVRL
jgi:hypothetical protein